MLAKKFDINKVSFPCVVFEKLDGVACALVKTDDSVVGISRQGNTFESISHLYVNTGLHYDQMFIGELYIPGKPFSYISGLARRKENSPELQLHVYDFQYPGYKVDFNFRFRCMYEVFCSNKNIKLIKVSAYCNSKEELLEFINIWTTANTNAEGLMIRGLHGKDSYYTPGKRSWGMQKYKVKHTVDLEVIDCIEAIDEQGNQKGMLGSFIVKYNDCIKYVGAGKLTHAERIHIWKYPEHVRGSIIEVSYMPDPDYEALRQSIFERFRNDKTEESYD